MGAISIWHIGFVLIIVLLLFGTGKLSGLMGDAAKGIRAFKDGLKDEPESDKKTETVKSEEPKA